MIIIRNRLDSILDDYNEYLKEDFPNSLFLKNYKKKKLNKVVSNSFKTLELIDLYRNHEKLNDEEKKLLDLIYESVLRFIYIMPLGDRFLYNALERNISEAILRLFILMFDDQKRYNDIKEMSYKKIKETLNEYPESKISQHKDILIFFKQKFGESSKVLHGKEIKTIDFLHSLQRKNICCNIKTLMEFTNNLLDVFQKNIPLIYNLDQTQYSTSQISILNMLT